MGRHNAGLSGGHQNRKKAPVAAFRPTTSKTPHAPELVHEDVLRRKPVWRFQLADHDGPWPFDRLDGEQVVELLRKLSGFESMTIGELFHRGDEPGKHYDTANMPSAATARLVEINRDDETRISRLRLTGTCRLYGLLREHVFYVLWWDPEHQVYPSQKKHT